MNEGSNFMTLEDLRARAAKAVELMDLMDKTFSSNAKENLIMVLMAAMADSYRKGIDDYKTIATQ